MMQERKKFFVQTSLPSIFFCYQECKLKLEFSISDFLNINIQRSLLNQLNFFVLSPEYYWKISITYYG